MTILYFIIGLGLLIFIHELGHFLVAKWNGIRVERFSLGFGPRILKFQVGETEYCLSALPLGGYVKMSGQEDFEEGEIVPLDDPKAFSSKSMWVRLKVVLAGPGMNLLLPFVLMPLVFLMGRQEPKFLHQNPQLMEIQEGSPAQNAGLQKGDVLTQVNGQEVKDWNDVLQELLPSGKASVKVRFQREGSSVEKEIVVDSAASRERQLLGFEPMLFIDNEAVIGELASESAAKSAGVQAGDRIVSIDGHPIQTWTEMSARVNASQGKSMQLVVEREAKNIGLSVTPVYNESLKKYVMGVSKASDPKNYELHRYDLASSLKKGVEENILLLGMTFKVLKDLVTLKASYKDLGGPIKIAEVSAQAAKKGLGNFLYLLAFLSIQLGVLNLLPIPVLDGGHVAFMLYEGIAKKPLPMKKKLIAQQVGMFLLLTLMVLVTINDIDSVWGFRQIFEKVKGWF